MIPSLTGQTVELARIDFGLHVWTNENWVFRLSCPVVVTLADESGVTQSVTDVDVEARELPDHLAPLVGETIDQVLVSSAGDLSIQLPAMHVTVRASERYEAWQLDGPDSEIYICLPGGSISYFAPLDKSADEDL